MKFVALVSGGKDSIFSIMEATKLGHELLACVHLGRPRDETEESYMYQTAGSECIKVLVEECLGVPLILHERVGKSVNTSLVYDGDNQLQNAHHGENQHDKNNSNDTSTIDEVEDLYQALATARERFPEMQAVSSGAILSTYQRVRIENVCSRLNLTSLSLLWRRDTQQHLLQRMIQAKIHAVLVRVAAPPGLTAMHLNKSLSQLEPLFGRLYDKYQFSVCGEGGEYETLVLDCPLYKKRLVLDEIEVIEDENDGVAVLNIRSCHAEAKNDAAVDDEVRTDALDDVTTQQNLQPVINVTAETPGMTMNVLPRACRAAGGLFHVSEIMASSAAHLTAAETSDSELAVMEVLDIFATLSKVLAAQGVTAQDVMMVNLYLSEMSLFAAINQQYREFFGTMLPPSRSCIGVGRNRLPGGRRVVLDCIVQVGSGSYMRAAAAGQQDADNYYAKVALANKSTQLRQVLHVQSISYWAPVCVGPYSQVNTYRSAVSFVAGQIGLRPETMTLRSTWTEQLEQAWINAARVLDAVKNGSLEHLIAGIIYVTDDVLQESGALNEIEAISLQQMRMNGGVAAGAIDGSFRTDSFHGYEDEGTMLECMHESDDGTESFSTTMCPLLVVSVPELPVNALAEVEIVAATKISVLSCPIIVTRGANRCALVSEDISCGDQWVGYDPPADPRPVRDEIHIDACWVSLGRGVIGSCLVTASFNNDIKSIDIDAELVLGSMIEQLSRMSQSSSTIPDLADVLQLRLYYVVSSGAESASNDGASIRSAFHSVISTCFACTSRLPSISIIPVSGLHLILMQNKSEDTDAQILLAIRANIVMDPTNLETELWIRDRN
ncbi:hypothetical protein MPSEU_000434900 [Mayamaea pseudoterrestris]|nr:hypothetical protein MPSEU_000434900 [Mayamaea pseudoterrestris]